MQAYIAMTVTEGDTSMMNSANPMSPVGNDEKGSGGINYLIVSSLLTWQLRSTSSYDRIHQELSLIKGQRARQHEENIKARKVKKDKALMDWLGQEDMDILSNH